MASKVIGKPKAVDTRKSSGGKTRGDFALPGRRMFPLNTAGRVAAAPGDAARAKARGTISGAEEKKVDRAAARKRGKGK